LLAEAERAHPEAVEKVLREQQPTGEDPDRTQTEFASTFRIALHVNGQRHEVTVDARTTLLDALPDL
jgi:hypothetical protein